MKHLIMFSTFAVVLLLWFFIYSSVRNTLDKIEELEHQNILQTEILEKVVYFNAKQQEININQDTLNMIILRTWKN